MNKLKLIVVSVLMLCGFNWAKAEIVDNYVLNFNARIDCYTDHAFSVGSGWGHIVDTYLDGDETSYVTYAWSNEYGVGGSGCLAFGNYRDTYDMIVSPLVKGTITLDVARRINGSSWEPVIEFYKITREGGSYVRGQKLATSEISLSTAEVYETITLNVDDWTMIGIRGSWVFIDNFTASQADVVLQPKMTIKSLTSNNPATVTADDNGKFTVSYNVVVENVGEKELTPGIEGYELVMKTDGGTVVGTQAIDQTIPVSGVSDAITFELELDINDYPGRTRYDVYSGLDATSYKNGDWIEPKSNQPVLIASRSGYDGVLNDGTVITLGLSKTNVTYPMTIKNGGGANLIIDEIQMPAGFTSDAVTPITIEPDGSTVINLTMDASEAGERSGNLIIKSNVADRTLELKGTIIDTDTWFANFENNAMPADMMKDGSNWSVYMNLVEQYNEINKYIATNNQVEPTKMITPKMHVDAGRTLKFEAARRDGDDSFVKVYYSADRSEWTEVYTASIDATNDADLLSPNKITAGLYSAYELKPFETTIPEGDWYIAFESGNAQLDNIVAFPVVAVEHDLMVTSLSLPSQGIVNSTFAVTAQVKNTLAKKEDVNDMTVEFHFGNDVQELDPQAIAAGSAVDYNFSYTPHAAGEQEAYFLVRIGDYEAKSEVKTVTVGEEVASTNVQVGEYKTTGNTGPADLYYKYSEVETIYTAEKLGLTPGTKITSLTYRGYTPAGLSAEMTMWMENTTDDTPTSSGTTMISTDGMTKICDATYAVEAVGSQSGSTYTTDEMMVINLIEPFVYDGNNLRIVTSEYNATTPSARFELDNTDQSHSTYRRSDNNDLNTKSFTTTSLPVVYLGIEKDPATFGGVVTAADGGTPIDGATVTLTSGDVMYSGTTASDGTYEVTVMQDALNYALKVVKAGYVPYIQNGVSVVETPTINVSLSAADGVIFEEIDAPTEGTVNSEMQISATLFNPTTQDFLADDYTVALYFNSEKVAEAKSADLLQEKSRKYRISMYPHKAGTFDAEVRFESGDISVASESFAITISEEAGSLELQIGEANNTSSDDKGFGSIYYNQTEMQTIYNAGIINLPAGAKIRSITIKGTPQSTKTLTAYQSLFLENTVDTELDITAPRDTTEMTRVFGKNVTLNLVNTMSDCLIFEFDEPFVYTGNNIRIAFHHASTGYQRTYWVSDSNGKCIVRYKDGDVSTAVWTVNNYMAVAYVTAEVEAKAEGTVTALATGQPIENAEVTLKSGGVEYYGTTDADGKYSVSVKKIDLDYDVIVKADTYIDDVQQVNFADGNVVLTHEMKQEYTLSGVVTDADDGSVLAGVSIILLNGDEEAAAVETDEEGKYTITLFDPLAASYTMVATLAGYDDFEDTYSFTELVSEKNFVMQKTRNIISGKVTGSDGNAIEGVAITLEKDGETLAATTDADGKYEIVVINADGDYNFTASKTQYEDFTTTVTFSGNDLTQDVTLLTTVEVGIAGVYTNTNGDNSVYTLDGQRVGKVGDKLPSGVYIMGGRKVVVK